jgi:hypothetical protein
MGVKKYAEIGKVLGLLKREDFLLRFYGLDRNEDIRLENVKIFLSEEFSGFEI